MTDYGKSIKEKLNIVSLDRNDFNLICKDRLDFGFDSIYFRYAQICDELAAYKSIVDHIDPIEARRRIEGRKRYFYNALERFVHAHDQEDEKNDFNK